MQLHDDGPVPERSQEELLAVVRSKAGRIRRRRLEVFCGVMAGVVLLAGSIAVAGMRGDDPGTTVGMASPSVTTALDGESSNAFTTTDSVPPDPSATATTVSPAGATSNPSGADGNTPAPAGGTQTAPANPAPAAPQDPDPVPDFGPAPEPCAPSDVVVTATTDRPAYAPGAPVLLTMTARNQSSHPCPRPTSFVVEFTDPAGNSAGGMGFHEDYFTAPPPLQPGQTSSETMTWPAKVCEPTCVPAAPGQYTVTATMNNHRSAPAAFTITG